MNKYNRKQLDPTNARDIEKDAQLKPIQGPILNWLTGENLYSLLARNHYYRGHPKPVDTIKVFFGTSTGRSLHDSLSEIEVFVAKTEGHLGTATYILDEHTLMRFYRIFVNQYEGQRIRQSGKSAQTMLKYPFALWTGRFRTMHPLKACPICAQNDQTNIGMSYWRLTHQFPGVWVCLEHDHPLLSASIKPTSQERFLWLTPGMQEFSEIPQYLKGHKNFERFKSLSEFIIWIVSNREFGVMYIAECRTRFLNYLEETDMLTLKMKLRIANNRNKVSDLCQQFTDFVDIFRNCPEFADLPKNVETSYRFLSRYLSGQSLLKPSEQLAVTSWIHSKLRTP